MLAPGPRDNPVQHIDGRDLGAWLVTLCEQRSGGTFNAVTPQYTMETFLETMRDALNPEARLVWVDADFLVEREVGQWMELPLWVVDDEVAGLLRADASRAIAAGLTFRPLADTARDALEQAELADAAGMKPEREAELLGEWASLASGG